MRISGGETEDGIIVGNSFDKYGSKNPIVRRMMAGFDSALNGIVAKTGPQTIHEIGCGEGFWVLEWSRKGMNARGTDFSRQVIGMAQSNARAQNIDPGRFEVRSIYDVDAGRDSADLIVCCEVMEHLEDPEEGFQSLQRVVTKDLILSVPREPLWRILNMARGHYLMQFGNTTGHVNNWSKRGIVNLASHYFDVVEELSPLPWTMIHCRPKRSV